MHWIWNAAASACACSTSTLATTIWPAQSRAIFSRRGASTRQGPHHSAQKSTTTGHQTFNALPYDGISAYLRARPRADDGLQARIKLMKNHRTSIADELLPHHPITIDAWVTSRAA